MVECSATLEVDLQQQSGNFQLRVAFSCTSNAIGLFGPSGAGKSTLLRIVSGLLRPDQGRVAVAGTVLCDTDSGTFVPVPERRIGIVFQEHRLFPHLSVEGNLGYGARFVPADAQRFDKSQLIELLELSPFLSKYPRALSGGEQQRVAIGRALLASPNLLLLDEPLASLDKGLQQALLPFLKRVRRELQIPMVYVSHRLGEIQWLCEEIVLIDDGRIVEHGSIGETFCRPRAQKLAVRLGLENLIEVVIEEPDRNGECRARLGEHTVVLPPTDQRSGSRVPLLIDPVDVILATESPTGVSVQNQLAGTVMGIDPVDQGMLVTVDVGVPLRAKVTRASVERLELAPGVPVLCLIKALKLGIAD